MLTEHRRNYADIQLIQEGHIIPEGNRMAIMGLPINKTTLSEPVKDAMQEILYEDILTADKVDQIRIMKKLAIMEKNIFDNIMAKKTDYYKPDNIAAMSTYDKNPLEVNGIVAALIYNEMRDENMPAINLEERNAITKIKINVNKRNVDRIRDTYPEEYGKLVALLNHPTLGSKVNVIGLPLDVEVPDWVLEFVDVQAIASDVLKNFPLEYIGLQRFGNDTANYTNIISL